MKMRWRLLKKVCKLAKTIDDKEGMGIALNILSQIAFRQGNLELAQQYGRESLAIVTELENRWSVSFSLENLGRVAYAKTTIWPSKRDVPNGIAYSRRDGGFTWGGDGF